MPNPTFNRRLLLSGFAMLTLLLGGCAIWRPATVPMKDRLERASCTAKAETLLVMLPGAYSHPDELVREGFVEAVQSRKLAADVLLVDAHMGYYMNKSIVDRLHQDVIAPARAKGYQKIWLAGISVGGFGSFIQAAVRPDDVDGILVISPYMGEYTLSTEIAAAGGLERWPGGAAGAGDETERRMWRLLQRQAATGAGTAARLPIFLGYATEDRFAFSHRLAAPVLPAERVFTTPGGHNWPEWIVLWRRMLDAAPIARCG